MFKITIFNNGYFLEAAFAADFELRLTRNGNWTGWVTKEQMEQLDKTDINYKVW